MLMILISFLCILLAVMFFSLLERKVLASSQLRLGPFRFLQALLDGLKLFFKSILIMPTFTQVLFFGSASIFLVLSLLIWLFLFNSFFVFFLFLIIVVVQSVSVYMPLIVSVSSNSKYATLAATRSIAQMISYEIVFSIMIFSIAFFLFKMFWPSFWMVFWLFFPFLLCWVVSCLAELNRTPFDLVESESELVSGFNVEYSSIPFALLFLAEYSYVMFFSFLTSYFFSLFLLFVFFWLFLFSRCVFPRMRYDLLMILCWQKLLPLVVIFTVFVIMLVW